MPVTEVVSNILFYFHYSMSLLIAIKICENVFVNDLPMHVEKLLDKLYNDIDCCIFKALILLQGGLKEY